MKIRWLPSAEAALFDAAAYIARDDPPAAAAFLRVIREKTLLLADFPLMGRATDDFDTRELIVHRNYLVTYQVHADRVEVIQVWHMARQRPKGR
jgi:toxin ParE1/3/4